MNLFLTILIVLAALFLILIVIIQNAKGGGLAAGFSSSNQVMGVRKTTDFLEKATWYLAGAVVILCVASTIYMRKDVKKHDLGIDVESIQQQETQSPADFAPFESSDVPAATEEPATPPAE